MTTQSAKIGIIGEDIACTYLANKGFRVIDRNYRKKYGEIDIVCSKGGITHFVEVKTVSRKTGRPSRQLDSHNPEDNMHKNKIERQKRVITAYLSGNSEIEDFVVDLITVKLDSESKTAFVHMLHNVIL